VILGFVVRHDRQEPSELAGVFLVRVHNLDSRSIVQNG
jgi:hypothetical protein